MALKFEDVTRETWTGTGTGLIALSGAVSGYIAISTIAANNDYVPYAIRNRDVPSEFEDGVGLYQSAGNQLVRSFVKRSSNGNAVVAFSAGTKDVYIGLPSEYLRSLFPIHHPFYQNDFLDTQVQTPPWLGAVISSGTITTALAVNTNIDGAHPGVVLIRSSVTTNSGARYMTQALDRMLIAGGEVFDCIFKTPAALTNTTVRWGMHTSTTSADAVDGVYFELPTGGTIVGKTANNSTRSTTAGGLVASVSTWYHSRITMNADATLATFELFDTAGAALMAAQTLNTNIPTARLVGSGLVATNVGTTAVDLLNLDYMSLRFAGRALARGRAF